VLATDGAELSAIRTLRQRQDAAASLGTLTPIRHTLTAAAARDRSLHLLTAAGLDDRQVAAVLASPAAGALLAALDTGTALSHRMPEILHRLIVQRPLDDPADPVRDLAAVLHARVSDWLANAETAQTASGGVDALLGRHQHHSPADPELRQALRDVDALIDARLDDLLQRPDPARTDTLGRPPDDPAARAEWHRHARTLAAYRDLTTPATSRSSEPGDRAAERRRRLLAHQAARAARTLTIPHQEGISPP
jgi:hypothetical protein